MKTQYYTASSLDGFIADRRNSLDWLLQFGDDMTTDYPDFIKNVGALVMGSTTYEWILENHIRPGADRERPWQYAANDLGDDIAHAADRERRGHSLRARRRRRDSRARWSPRRADKNIWIVGGGDLVGQFHDRGLLDEIIVTIASVTLGGGAPLLPREIVTPPLKLTSATMLSDGFAQLRYDVRRAPR